MTSRRGFLSTLAAAVAAPFLPKLPPIKIKNIPNPMDYWPTLTPQYMFYAGPPMEIWPKPPFDYKENLERAARHLQKMAAEIAVENGKDLEFLSGDRWVPIVNPDGSRRSVQIISRSSVSPSLALDSPSLGCVPQCSEPDSPHSPAA